MKKMNPNGFSTVEGLLILIVVAIIGGTGWFVWHAKQSTDKTLSDTANSQPALQTKKTDSKTDTQVNGDTAKSSVKYLVIGEWGVKFPYEGSDTLSYKLNTDDSTESVSVIVASMSSQYPGCSTSGVAGIVRDSATNPTYYARDLSTAGKLGDHYYFFAHHNGPCAENPTAASAEAEAKASDFVRAIVAKVEAK